MLDDATKSLESGKMIILEKKNAILPELHATYGNRLSCSEVTTVTAEMQGADIFIEDMQNIDHIYVFLRLQQLS